MSIHRLPASSCPSCGKRCSAASPVHGEDSPKKGDLTLCSNCLEVLAFEDDGAVRIPNEAELQELDEQVVLDLALVRKVLLDQRDERWVVVVDEQDEPDAGGHDLFVHVVGPVPRLSVRKVVEATLFSKPRAVVYEWICDPDPRRLAEALREDEDLMDIGSAVERWTFADLRGKAKTAEA